MIRILQTKMLNKRQAILSVFVLLGIVVVAPKITGFTQSLHMLTHVRPAYVAAAVVLTLLTYVAAAGTYYLLAFKHIPFRQTVIVQLAAMFINRLLPAGLGAVGANYSYLRRKRHSASQAATIVSINNLLGFTGHALLTLCAIALFHSEVPALKLPSVNGNIIGLSVLVVLLLAVVFALATKWRMKLQSTASDIVKQLARYRRSPLRASGALLTSTILTLCNVLSLWLCLYALGGHGSFVMVLLVFTFGIGVGAATPTPGGLGGLEAGLVAGFIAYHVPDAAALAAVILYRTISYWFTLVIGAISFVYCQRKALL